MRLPYAVGMKRHVCVNEIHAVVKLILNDAYFLNARAGRTQHETSRLCEWDLCSRQDQEVGGPCEVQGAMQQVSVHLDRSGLRQGRQAQAVAAPG